MVGLYWTEKVAKVVVHLMIINDILQINLNVWVQVFQRIAKVLNISVVHIAMPLVCY